jgi:3',5'-cyclic AMP phosphodiesterase CpdA
MIAVISDLHFEEESCDTIHGEDGEDELSVPRNISAAPFCRLIADLARAAERNRADDLCLVLAGDVFELYQTALWFDGDEELRPYQSTVEDGSPLERKLLRILDATADEKPVREALELFRLLTSGRYFDGSEEKDFPVPVSIEYLPGNHDRPINATAALRRKARDLLGMGDASERFPNYLLLENPSALIRHGHEYDFYNFAADYSGAGRIPLHVPQAEYDAPTFGDFITIDVLARLPVEFRRVHTPEGILADPVKRKVYLRLLEFEDVRPQSALLPYLLKMRGHDSSEQEIWAVLEPVVHNVLEAIHDHPFLHQWLDEWGKAWRPDRTDLARLGLKALTWRKGISLTEAKAIGWLSGKAEKSVIASVYREEVVQEGTVRSVICGHTHSPTMEVATMHGERECQFFDVGTWRHRMPMAHDESGFGSVKSLTYLILYGSQGSAEMGSSEEAPEPFDYWSGTSRGFPD